MRNEVRQRIEQIRQGKVPAGYKKSAIGIFPEDWEIVSLSQFFSFKNGINAEKESFGRGTKLISVKDILSEQAITYDSIQGMISLDEEQKEAFKVQYGDILFQRSSENYEDVGKSNVYLDKKRDAVFSGFVIRGQKIADYDPVYLNEVLRLPYVRKQIQRLGAGAQHINIGQDSLKNVHIAVAEKKEQEKLTSICLQQMKVIRFKEKLLAEKLRRKQYLIQLLVTGKKRLPGFTEKWEKVKLNKLLHERKIYSSKGNGYPHVTLGVEGIFPKTERYDREHLVKSADKEYKITRKGDICYNPANLKFGVICENTYGDAIFSPIYVTFEVKPNICREFIALYLMRWDFIHAVMKYEEGTVYERMAVKPDDFLKYEMYLPSYEEQKAIAHIFSLINQEIDLLRQVLEQERRKKKALMQMLLSGIVRVRP